MKSRDEIAQWKREDKRTTKKKHTIVTSLDGKKQYQLMGTLDEEESNNLQKQLGINLKGKVVLGTGQFGKVRLIRDEEGTFYAVKKIKSVNTKSNFDQEALKREDQFNDILREKNISGVMRPIDAFCTTDSKNNSVMFQIMPLANLRDGENFRKLQSLLEIDMNNKPDSYKELIQQLKSFNNHSHIDEKESIEPEENEIESEHEENDADLLESSDEEEKNDADLLGISEDEEEEEYEEEHLHSDFLSKAILFHITQSLVKTVNEMHLHGIYHRDIHTKNILFDSKGRIYLSDFGTGIAYDQDKVAVLVTNKLQNTILPPEAKFPRDKELHKEFIVGSPASQQSIDQWELGCTLLSFITPEPSELLNELKMSSDKIQKLIFSGENSQYLSYVNYMNRKLEKFDKEVLSKTNVDPAVRKVILGLLKPDYKKRMSLKDAVNIMNEAKLPNDEIIFKTFHLLAQYQPKQDNKLDSKDRFFANTKENDREQPTLPSITIK